MVERPIEEVADEEVKRWIEKLKDNKATEPDRFLKEVAKKLGETEITRMREIMTNTQKNGIPPGWRKSKITSLFKQRGDLLNCSDYSGIRLLRSCLKLGERVVEARPRNMVTISNRQYRFKKYS